jgi:hypothetical protein
MAKKIQSNICGMIKLPIGFCLRSTPEKVAAQNPLLRSVDGSRSMRDLHLVSDDLPVQVTAKRRMLEPARAKGSSPKRRPRISRQVHSAAVSSEDFTDRHEVGWTALMH